MHAMAAFRRAFRRQTAGRIPRALSIVVFALQLLLWGGGTIIDARVAAESFTRVAHVEDTANTTCPPIHRDVDCLVCRSFSSGATSGVAPAIAILAVDDQFSPTGTVVRHADRRPGSPLGSRAPPAA
jgi:hypothetical protein